jgi:hypothetical protein
VRDERHNQDQSNPNKLYVLVRQDLSPGLQLAQAVHAAVEYTLAHPDEVAKTPNVVVLSVRGEDELLDWADLMCGWCSDPLPTKPYALFFEPDISSHTALACISDGREFASLPLAGGCMV